MLYFTSACYGGHANAKGGRTFGVNLFAFKESAGSFDHKQVGDALRAALNETLATTVPFSRCQW